MTSTNTLIDNAFILDQVFSMMEKGDVKEMTYAIERIFDEEYAKGMEKGIIQGKKEAAKALIGLLEDEIIAEKIGLKLEEVKKLH